MAPDSARALAAFERALARYTQQPAALALPSSASARSLALHLLGLRTGDELWLPSASVPGSLATSSELDLRPVFVDSEARSWNLDPERLGEGLARADARGRLPKAVLVADRLGQCADWDPIRSLCAAYGVPLLEDASEALGASYRGHPSGSFGRLGVLCFGPGKLLSCGGGGALVGEVELIARARRLLAELPGLVAVSGLLARCFTNFGLAQLDRLEQLVDEQRASFSRYAAGLRDLPRLEPMPEPPSWRSTRWRSAISLDPHRFGLSARALRERLAASGFDARELELPAHSHPEFATCRRIGGEVAERLAAQTLCLPSGARLSRAGGERAIKVTRIAHHHARSCVSMNPRPLDHRRSA